MQKYDEYLYDYIDRSYDRKNLFIKKTNEIKRNFKGKERSDKLKELNNDADIIKYKKELADYKNKEKEFLKSLREGKKKFYKSYTLNNKIKKQSWRLERAKRLHKFYQPYIELSYDAEYNYKISGFLLEQLPEIVEFLDTNFRNLHNTKEQLKTTKLTSTDKSQLKEYKKSLKIEAKEKIQELKKLLNDGVIPKKVVEEERVKLKLRHKNDIIVKKNSIPYYSLRERRYNLRYLLTKEYKKKVNILNEGIAFIRRNTPIEKQKSVPKIVFVLLSIFPGVGQLINKQYKKAAVFFIGTLYIYIGAIPYALGYGNYQGTGIEGIITLAKNGLRIDKSIIYLIEGLIGVFLLILAVGIVVLNLVDCLKVAKKEDIGTRNNNWFESKRNLSQQGFPYLISSPSFIAILFIIVIPVITGTLVSFTNMDPKHQTKFSWIGFDNYTTLLSGDGMVGSIFWRILAWTIIWTVVSTSLAIFIGFALAKIVNNERIKGKKLFRSIFILPWAVPSFVTIMFFSIMMSKQGYITDLIHTLTGLSLDMKNDPIQAKITLLLMQGWLGSAYIFVLFTGVLQGVPNDLYEAAQIDGASAWQKTTRITLPLVLFQTAPLLVGQYTFNFNNFSVVYLFNEGGPFNPELYGSLAGSTDLLISYIIKLTMDNHYQAVGAAITTMITIFLVLFAYFGMKNSKSFKEVK